MAALKSLTVRISTKLVFCSDYTINRPKDGRNSNFQNRTPHLLLLIQDSHFGGSADGSKTLLKPESRSGSSFQWFIFLTPMFLPCICKSTCISGPFLPVTQPGTPALIVTSTSNFLWFTFLKSTNTPFFLKIWIFSNPLTNPCVHGWNFRLLIPDFYLLFNLLFMKVIHLFIHSISILWPRWAKHCFKY